MTAEVAQVEVQGELQNNVQRPFTMALHGVQPSANGLGKRPEPAEISLHRILEAEGKAY